LSIGAALPSITERPSRIGGGDLISHLSSRTKPLSLAPHSAALGSALPRLTGFCLRHRLLVAGVWLVAIALGVVGAFRLTPLLSSGFSLPGTDSNRVKQVLASEYGVRTAGRFVLITKGDQALVRARRAGERAVTLLPDGKVDWTESLPSGAAAVFIESRLAGAQAAARTGVLRKVLGPGVFVTGDAAIQHDIGPVLAHDLRVGELYLAVPVALVILLFVFGTASALLPFLFAAATIPPALGIAWGFAHVLELSDYLRNMVLMIGLGIAIDYSLLVVSRYRDERRRGLSHEQAVTETMLHAGRTIVFSGLAVSVGLVLMLLLPVPFLRGFGVGGLLVPMVSVLCALTLLPVMLATFGRQLERVRIIPRGLAERRHAGELRLWTAHARWVMRRAKLLAPLIVTLLVLAAMPLIGIRVGPGSYSSLPKGIAAMRGLTILEHSTTRHSLDPTTVIVDTHRTDGAGPMTAAVHRLDRLLRADREVVTVSTALDAGRGRYLRIDVVGRHDPASPQAQAFADRLRSRLIPAAGFPASAKVIAGGGGASATDFVSRTLGSFPWLILGVLALTYLLLVRAFRSLLLPLKAIVLNLLTVAAASGLMIAVFQWGWGSWAGFLQVSQIEGWIPVFMFTLLFGLSMDYEVFLVTRMREAWDKTRSNTGAVAHGLANTGRIVTAAGLIMAATFSGFLLGSIPPMQQLGFGLAVAILIDITLIRGLLLPSTMALAGRWNWYLPVWTARALRVRP
jgi:putative drug exporter of the RND superfamily